MVPSELMDLPLQSNASGGGTVHTAQHVPARHSLTVSAECTALAACQPRWQHSTSKSCVGAASTVTHVGHQMYLSVVLCCKCTGLHRKA
jgi:hypothetical protein